MGLPPVRAEADVHDQGDAQGQNALHTLPHPLPCDESWGITNMH